MLKGSIKYSIKDREETNIIVVDGSFFHLGNISKDKMIVKTVSQDKVVLSIEKGEDSVLRLVGKNGEETRYLGIENGSTLEIKVGDKIEFAWYDSSIDPMLITPILLELVSISAINNFRL